MDIASKGNSKMGKEVYVFNLPAKITCTPTDWCIHGKNGEPMCYALRNNFLLKSVIESANKRFEISKKENFVSDMIEFLKIKKPKYFRIHSSGDFYSEEYVNKWLEIAKNCPEIKFRSSTHRKDLKKSIELLNSLENVIIRESLDDSHNEQKLNLKFSALSHLKIVDERESYHCPNDCVGWILLLGK